MITFQIVYLYIPRLHSQVLHHVISPSILLFHRFKILFFFLDLNLYLQFGDLCCFIITEKEDDQKIHELISNTEYRIFAGVYIYIHWNSSVKSTEQYSNYIHVFIYIFLLFYLILISNFMIVIIRKLNKNIN